MRIFLLLLCISFGGFTSTKAQTDLKKGVVLDSIRVSGTTDETFALYLPSSYDPQGLSPIVFIFEPAARGAIGIQPFIATSEKRGHILVCSNNSRNAPYERNFKIANALFNHIFTHFSIKEDEMYVSGFSGGARLAAAIATLTDQFAGVIGCGAGFSGVPGHTPSIQKYAYVGLCGDRDMNYKEMVKNKEFLSLMELKSTLITYDGEHQWPPSEQIERAFDWLYLQKVITTRPLTKVAVRPYYQADVKILEALSQGENKLLLAEQYERMLEDYAGLLPLDSLETVQKELLSSPVHKKQLASLEGALQTERKLIGKLVKQLQTDLENPNKVNFGWWEKEVAKLTRIAKDGDEETQKMVFRVKFDLFVRAYSRKNAFLHQTNQEQAALVDHFITLFYPKSK
ncbi:hypothetical protein [Flagellimonas allohymeniacidonis]|uniref:Phospholipase/carboxylesterase/thioesterase domain-containing protein n=1 Tax=Flagellimonas allohymeniacidonis TaxID=2517819 RepID=A0A4Q8QB88_9FLAO|nr:hypothetical protein [Allomuricauda hymeniacidonis]TAI47612.1 hypothetical protein EW142_13185 [Allomuricauda hymeniacidonis]